MHVFMYMYRNTSCMYEHHIIVNKGNVKRVNMFHIQLESDLEPVRKRQGYTRHIHVKRVNMY